MGMDFEQFATEICAKDTYIDLQMKVVAQDGEVVADSLMAHSRARHQDDKLFFESANALDPWFSVIMSKSSIGAITVNNNATHRIYVVKMANGYQEFTIVANFS